VKKKSRYYKGGEIPTKKPVESDVGGGSQGDRSDWTYREDYGPGTDMPYYHPSLDPAIQNVSQTPETMREALLETPMFAPPGLKKSPPPGLDAWGIGYADRLRDQVEKNEEWGNPVASPFSSAFWRDNPANIMEDMKYKTNIMIRKNIQNMEQNMGKPMGPSLPWMINSGLPQGGNFNKGGKMGNYPPKYFLGGLINNLLGGFASLLGFGGSSRPKPNLPSIGGTFPLPGYSTGGGGGLGGLLTGNALGGLSNALSNFGGFLGNFGQAPFGGTPINAPAPEPVTQAGGTSADPISGDPINRPPVSLIPTMGAPSGHPLAQPTPTGGALSTILGNKAQALNAAATSAALPVGPTMMNAPYSAPLGPLAAPSPVTQDPRSLTPLIGPNITQYNQGGLFNNLFNQGAAMSQIGALGGRKRLSQGGRF